MTELEYLTYEYVVFFLYGGPFICEIPFNLISPGWWSFMDGEVNKEEITQVVIDINSKKKAKYHFHLMHDMMPLGTGALKNSWASMYLCPKLHTDLAIIYTG